MIRQVCSGCGTWLAWGLFRCPRCSTVAPLYAARAGEVNMPRITVNSGASNGGAAVGEVGYIEPDRDDVPVEVRNEDEGELVVLPNGRTSYVASIGSDWAAMTIVQLREEAKQRGLSPAGAKADLVARLAEHDDAFAGTVDEGELEAELEPAEVSA